MSSIIISGTQTSSFHLSTTSRKSVLETKPFHVSFNTNFSKPKKFMRSLSTSATINSFYATTETNHSFYDLLGIPESVTLPEIKRAYKQLAIKYHPDVSPAECKEENTRTFIRVQEAYETLSDSQTRAAYDINIKNRQLIWKQRSSRETMNCKNVWNSQLTDLKMRNVKKDFKRSMSWGDRVRNQRTEAFVL